MISRSCLAAAAIAAVLVLTACTADEDPLPTAPEGRDRPCVPGPDCSVEATSDGTTYLLGCVAVPEALVDIELPRGSGRRPIRAIAGVSSTHGVAVMWRDPTGCGEWILALAEGLDTDAARSIRDEMARGVARFGVTTSPVPKEPGTS